MYIFFRIFAFKFAKSTIVTQKFFLVKQYQYGYKKAEFYIDFKLADAGFQKCL